MSHDIKCLELAEEFISDVLGDKREDYAALCTALAEEIQTTIEDFLACHTGQP